MFLKILWWMSIVLPLWSLIWWISKKVFLGITWPFRWCFRALWRKLRGKNKYLKELEALETKGEFHRWHSSTTEAFELSGYESAPNVLYEASGRKRSVYDKMCKQVVRLFEVGDDWGMSSGDDFFWG